MNSRPVPGDTVAVAGTLVAVFDSGTISILCVLFARGSSVTTSPVETSSPAAVAAVTITVAATMISAAIVPGLVVVIVVLVVIVIVIATAVAPTIRAPAVIVKIRIAAKLSSPASRHLATTHVKQVSGAILHTPNVKEEAPNTALGVESVRFVEPESLGYAAQRLVAAHDPGDGLPGFTTRIGEDVTHGVGKAFVEVSGSGDGPSIDIVHLSPGKDDLRHVIVALPLRDGLGREETVQDEEDIGARFVCFGDELVGVHFGWSRSSEIAVASEVSDRFR